MATRRRTSLRSASGSSREATGRRTSGRRVRPGRGNRKATPALLLGGIGVAAVGLVLAVMVILNGGKGAQGASDAAVAPAKPSNPTEQEMNDARALYREARSLSSQAQEISSRGDQVESLRLRKEALAKVERAIAIWNDMMSRVPESDRDKYVKYEDDEVRHWNLLARQLWVPDHEGH